MKKKYELLEREKNGLCRIRALRDFGDVKKGDIGGYIQKEENLSQDNDCWVYRNAEVFGNAMVHGDARIYGNAMVYGDANVYGNAWVSNNSKCSINAINITSLRWNTTITDNNIHIGCKTFELNKALKLASRWTSTLEKYDDAKTISDEKKLIVEAIKLQLKRLNDKGATK